LISPLLLIALAFIVLTGIVGLNYAVERASQLPDTSFTDILQPSATANATANTTINTLTNTTYQCDTFFHHIDHWLPKAIGDFYCGVEGGFYNIATLLNFDPFRLAFIFIFVLAIIAVVSWLILKSGRWFSTIFGIIIILGIIFIFLLMLGMI